MDNRIGTLMRDGNTVYYAFADGYDKPEVCGSIEEVEAALGLRQSAPTAARDIAAAGRPGKYRQYLVTLSWLGLPETANEQVAVWASNHAAALRKGRDWKRNEYGRTRSCNLLPCTFRARLVRDGVE